MQSGVALDLGRFSQAITAAVTTGGGDDVISGGGDEVTRPGQRRFRDILVIELLALDMFRLKIAAALGAGSRPAPAPLPPPPPAHAPAHAHAPGAPVTGRLSSQVRGGG